MSEQEQYIYDTPPNGSEFEKIIQTTFDAYLRASIARLAMMPVPTRVIKKGGGAWPCAGRVTTGKAPFDIYGFRMNDGVMIGAELKSSHRKHSLPIVRPGAKSDGLQFHQLDALAQLARADGIARLVWCNGGEIGVIEGRSVLSVWMIYDQALKSMMSGKSTVRGAKSIRWELFMPVPYREVGGVKTHDWLLLL